MKIIYLNNCWFTNVGEAFIDIGGLYLTKSIFSESKVACISAMTNYYVDLANQKAGYHKIFKKNVKSEMYDLSDMSKHLMADYVIMPGMLATEEFLSAKSKFMVDKLHANGCKVVFLGLGGLKYDDKEREVFSRYLDEIQPEFVMTRDDVTYDNYKDVAPCVKGIDCAFWTIDL